MFLNYAWLEGDVWFPEDNIWSSLEVSNMLMVLPVPTNLTLVLQKVGGPNLCCVLECGCEKAHTQTDPSTIP